MSRVTFNNQNSPFFQSVKRKVEEYFREKNLKTTGNFKLYLKTIILVPLAITMYSLLLFLSLPSFISIVLCALLGFTMASIGFNVMHDANHGSYSTKKWINNLMGLSANCMGINAFIWKQKHNIIHHTYTNVDGIDDDIAKMPLLRQCPSQIYLRMHRYQHIYCVPLYGLTSLLWTFLTDFIKYFSRKIHTTSIRKMELKQHMIFWLSKILYVIFYIALPIKILGFAPFIIGFLILHLALGLTLAMVFQLAHVVEDTHFVNASEKEMKIEDEWAIFQIQTTANFATKNKVISWFVGGLNFQVEHHLFPKISHVHYPVISQIVEETCQKFGLRYINYPTMSKALGSHFRFMKQLGAQ